MHTTAPVGVDAVQASRDFTATTVARLLARLLWGAARTYMDDSH
jgi:hypothetical protein